MHVQKRTQGGKSSWRARYRTVDGRERSKTFDRKIDAERWLVGVQSELARGTYIDPKAGRVTFAEYAEQWRRAQVHRPSTTYVLASKLRNHILPTFGHRALGSILSSEVQAWVRGLSRTLAPATVEVCYRHLSAIMRSAVADRLIHASPCVRIQLPTKHKERVDPLSVEQVQTIRTHAPERFRALIDVAAGTGLRRGEVCGLTLDRIDFLRRRLTVDRQLVMSAGVPVTFGPPKTQSSIRTIPVPDVVLDQINRHLAAFPIDHEWGFIFTTAGGRPWSASRFAEIWRTAARAAGLPDSVRFHDLRHHTASLLIAAGCSVKAVQNQLGHASATETLDTYGHLWASDEDNVRAAVNAAFESSSGRAQVMPTGAVE